MCPTACVKASFSRYWLVLGVNGFPDVCCAGLPPPAPASTPVPPNPRSASPSAGKMSIGVGVGDSLLRNQVCGPA